MDSFFTWQTLMTYSGATLAVTFVTQLVKGVPVIVKLPTRLVSYFIAVTVMLLAGIFTDGFTWSGFAMAFINGAVVALAANGAFDSLNAKSVNG